MICFATWGRRVSRGVVDKVSGGEKEAHWPEAQGLFNTRALLALKEWFLAD